MKKTNLCAVIFTCWCGLLLAPCTQQAHVKERKIKGVKTTAYQCPVNSKALYEKLDPKTVKKFYQKDICKVCGCSKNFHVDAPGVVQPAPKRKPSELEGKIPGPLQDQEKK